MLCLATQHSLLSAYAQADFFGKCIFFGLFLISLICWSTLISKTLQLHKARQLASAFEQVCSRHKEHLLKLTVDGKQKQHPFGRVFTILKEKTLEILNKNRFFSEEKEEIYLTHSDLHQVESHVLITISSEAKNLEKNLFILSTIYTLAPFLGLLGTVWGILVTFSSIEGGATASNTAMLGGLSTALSTTVLGLLIAIPALISHSWLRHAFKYLHSDMEDFMYTLLSTVEMQYRKPH